MGLDYENRGFDNFAKIKIFKSLPTFVDPNSTEFDICKCVEYQVYGKLNGQSWEQDISGAWMKSYPGDTVEFVLKLDGVIVDYPIPTPFVNDLNSYYCQIYWTDQLTANGIGCYELSINYTIGGIADSLIWAEYHLNEFDILKVKNTVRIKSTFNSNQTIEGIDFTNSKVIDIIRFDGYFGDRQPNTFIDNIIYSDRSMNKVVRENLNKYYLESKNLPLLFIDKIIDLHLLSENEVYISDYNFKNPVKYYLDFPCIVSESAEIEYMDGVDKPSFKCIFSDKVKNTKSYY